MKKPSVMLVIENKKEKEILSMAFNQREIETIESNADHNAYLKTVQYVPDVIILQMPKKYIDQSRYLTSIQQNNKTKKIPIIAYSSHLDDSLRQFLKNNGAKKIYSRPLKFSLLIKNITMFLEAKGKKLDIKEKLNDMQKDLMILFDRKASKDEKVEIVANYTSKLMAFPHTLTKVISISNDSTKGASDLAKIIQSDLAISGAILKLSNSVFFARNKRKIADIKESIVRIGLNETKRLVMAISAMEMFAGEDNSIGFDRQEFWEHSLTTGIIAEKLSSAFAGELQPNVAFILGILHEFSLLIADNFFSPYLNKMIQYTINKMGQFEKVSRKLTGIKLSDITANLFQKWQFPSYFIEAISSYNDVDFNKEKFDKNENIYPYIISLAEKISKSLNFGKECDLFVGTVSNNAFKLLKQPTGFSEALREKVMAEYDMYKSFLNIKKKVVDFEFDKSVVFINLTQDYFVPVENYLKENNIDVISVKKVEDVESLDETKEYVFLYWIDKTVNNDVIDNFIKVLDDKISPKKSVNQTLMFIDKKIPILDYIKSLNCGYYYNEFDLRNIFEMINNSEINKIDPYKPDYKDIENLRKEIYDMVGVDEKENSEEKVVDKDEKTSQDDSTDNSGDISSKKEENVK